MINLYGELTSFYVCILMLLILFSLPFSRLYALGLALTLSEFAKGSYYFSVDFFLAYSVWVSLLTLNFLRYGFLRGARSYLLVILWGLTMDLGELPADIL